MKTKQPLLLLAFCLHALCCFHFTTTAQIPTIKLTGDSCKTLTVGFSLLNSIAPVVFWHFNDPPSLDHDTLTVTGGPGSLAFHSFYYPGTYNVCAYFQEPGKAPDSVCRNFEVGICCNGAIKVQGNCITNVSNFFLETGASYNSISWDFGDPTSGPRNTGNGQSVYHVFLQPGTYKVTAKVKATCGDFVVSKTVTMTDCQQAVDCSGNVVVTDTCGAEGTYFSISSTNRIKAIQWDFGDPATNVLNLSNLVNAVHRFSAPGGYRVQVIVQFDCGFDTAFLPVNIPDCASAGGPLCVTNFQNRLYCRDTASIFALRSDSSIVNARWNFGDPSGGVSNSATGLQVSHSFSKAGSFEVSVIFDQNCGTDTLRETVRIDECPVIDNCNLVMPNAFSPNGDGQNDLITPRMLCDPDHFDWQIFNRWGQLVYKATNRFGKWDGTENGKPLPAGVYYYLLIYKLRTMPEKRFSGSILLIR